MSGVHASVQPSSLGMYVACHAYLSMAAPYANDPPTEEQLEGDAAHWLALEYVSGNEHAIGVVAPNGIAATEDMVDGAKLWRDSVGYGGVAEQPVVCAQIHADCWGTPDHWRADMIEKILWVSDYKFGFRFVEVFENFQLGAGYAAGILDMLGINGHEEQQWRVGLRIVQPRSYHVEGPVRVWGPFPATDLRGLVNRAKFAVDKSLQPNPDATVGAHCLDCPARHECKTLQRFATGVAQSIETAERVNLPAPAVAAELTILTAAAKMLEARVIGLQQQALAMLRRGERVPGFAIEHPEGNLAWDVPAGEVFTLGDLLDVDLRKPAAPITPTQAKKKIDEAVISGYASRPRGAARLAIDSTTAARKLFGVNAT